MESPTTITVLMPVYNQSDFVRCAVKSLLRQTFTDWELVIIDDGSKDGLREAVDDFLSSDHRINYCRNESNEGLGFSLNRGLELAKGKYISYLPADDIYFENHLQTMYDKAEKECADFVYSGIVYNFDKFATIAVYFLYAVADVHK